MFERNELPQELNAPMVFVVDDNASVVETLSMVLEREGFYVHGFLDPQQALEIARHDAPEFLLTDYNMPHMNGMELCLAMHSVDAGCRLIMVSGAIDADSALELAEEQGINILAFEKPVDIESLLEVMRLADEQRGTAASA